MRVSGFISYVIICSSFFFLAGDSFHFLEGSFYEKHNEFGSADWNFEKNGTFDYYQPNSKGGRFGMGKYIIEADSVHFLFEKYPREEEKKQYLSISKQDSSVLEWEFNFVVADVSSGEAIQSAGILLKDTLGNLIGSTETNLEGIAALKITSYNGKLILKIINEGYHTMDYTLSEPGSYLAKAYLQSSIHDQNYIDSGTRMDYKVLKMEKNAMTWQTSYKDSISHDVQVELVRKKEIQPVQKEIHQNR